MKKYYFSIFLTISVISFILIFWSNYTTAKIINNLSSIQVDKVKMTSKFVLEETDKMANSANPDWWLNSGGLAYFVGDIIKTNQGDLSEDNYWYLEYAKNNPRDTDKGIHPQNIFRLVTRSQWKNLEQQAYFKINKDNLSASIYRNQSNGLLLFNRYQDGMNLYYTGIRVDGNAVIKKKVKGIYYTIAIKKIFPGIYERTAIPNLLPKDTWLGIKSEVMDSPDGSVNIKLFLDQENNGNWQLALEAYDNGKVFGDAPFLKSGYAGIRTDFMDVEIKDYNIKLLKNE